MFCNAIDGLLLCWINQGEWRNLQSDDYDDSEKIFVFYCHTVTVWDNILTVRGLCGDREMRLLSPQVTK
jgi:hypothetical protein